MPCFLPTAMPIVVYKKIRSINKKLHTGIAFVQKRTYD